jgi:hypothetical protein
MKQPFSLKVVTILHCPLHFSYGQALDQVSCLFLYESSCLYLYESCYGLSSRLESIFDMLFQIIELHDEAYSTGVTLIDICFIVLALSCCHHS